MIMLKVIMKKKIIIIIIIIGNNKIQFYKRNKISEYISSCLLLPSIYYPLLNNYTIFFTYVNVCLATCSLIL